MGNEQYPRKTTGGGTTTVADAAARLALTGLSIGAEAYQSDNGFFYKLIGADASVEGNWYRVPVVQSAVLEADFPKDDDTLTAVPDLTLNLEAGHRYRITGQMSAVGAGGSALIDLAGGTVVVAGVGGLDTKFDAGGVALVPITDLTDFLCGEDGGSSARTVIDLVVDVETSGTLVPRFAQLSTNIAASVLRKYSAIYATDITPG